MASEREQPASDKRASSRPTAEERASSMINQIIDSRYRIIEPIGEGGMGWVYRAEHIKIRRSLAIKLLNPEYREYSGLAARFEREAFAAGRLDHPNCVAVSDCGVLEDGTVYLAMELLDGVSLAEELDAHVDGLGVERSLHIVQHLLRGLGHAHDAGVIHRDIKPDNVLLIEQDGDPDFVKLLDFGIAKLIGEAIEEAGGKVLTESGLTMGTPFYMSPEQAFGKPLDGRSDLYAASVLLYEMLTGHLPFYDEDKLVVLSMHTKDNPPLFSEIAPHLAIPTEVELLVRNGLAKDPAERIRTASAYVNRIDRVLATLATRSGKQQVSSPPSDGSAIPSGPVRASSVSAPMGRGRAVDPVAPTPLATEEHRAGSMASVSPERADSVAPRPDSTPSGGELGGATHDHSGVAPSQPPGSGEMPLEAPLSRPGTAPPSGPLSSQQSVVDPSQLVMLENPGDHRSGTHHGVWTEHGSSSGVRNWFAHWGANWRALSRGVRWAIVGSTLLFVILAITSGGQRSGATGDAAAVNAPILSPGPSPVEPRPNGDESAEPSSEASPEVSSEASADVSGEASGQSAGQSSGESGAESSAGESAEISAAAAPSDVSARALAALNGKGGKDKRARAALAILQGNDVDITADPYGQLMLGHALMIRKQMSKAMTAYARAVELAPQLGLDQTLRRNLTRAFAVRDNGAVDGAIAVMETVVATTGDEEAQAQLVAMASRHDLIYTRFRAFEVAESLGLGDQIDRLASFLLDLEQSPKCESRRRMVAKLRALGDRRAIPALRTARRRMRPNGRFGAQVNTNACLVEDADEAVQFLESM